MKMLKGKRIGDNFHMCLTWGLNIYFHNNGCAIYNLHTKTN